MGAAVADMSDRLTVRGVDPVVWRRARLAALRHDLTMGEAVNEALRAWLAGVGAPAAEDERPMAPMRRQKDRQEASKR